MTPGGPAPDRADVVAVEEPLEIRIAGDTVAITMRTPGADHALTAGFLLSEGIIRSVDDLGTLSHCGRTDQEGYGNALDVLPAPGGQLVWERVTASRRGTLTSAACGVCGREQIDDLLDRIEPLGEAPLVDAALVASAPDRLRAAQRAFDRTGGTHAAMVLAADGTVLAVHEDVGRHNAVDKAVGTLVLAGAIGPCRAPAPGPRPALLVVSGRSTSRWCRRPRWPASPSWRRWEPPPVWQWTLPSEQASPWRRSSGGEASTSTHTPSESEGPLQP
jgi:FdhD protein